MRRSVAIVFFLYLLIFVTSRRYDIIELTNPKTSELTVYSGIYKNGGVKFLVVQGIIVKINDMNISSRIDIYRNTTSGEIGYFASDGTFFDTLKPLQYSPIESELHERYKYLRKKRMGKYNIGEL